MSVCSRVPSPPVPAVKHRLGLHPPSQAEEQAGSHGWPSSPDYVPYVRTNEVYHLDPLAPISRPTTHEGQRHIRAGIDCVGRSARQTTLIIYLSKMDIVV